MTFEQALKWLAEKWPEKFKIELFDDGSVGAFGWMGCAHTGIFVFTQDDIDDALAEIGWEYEVHPLIEGHQTKWSPQIWKKGTAFEELNASPDEWFDSKLEAAKAALVAVIKKEKGARR